VSVPAFFSKSDSNCRRPELRDARRKAMAMAGEKRSDVRGKYGDVKTAVIGEAGGEQGTDDLLSDGNCCRRSHRHREESQSRSQRHTVGSPKAEGEPNRHPSRGQRSNGPVALLGFAQAIGRVAQQFDKGRRQAFPAVSSSDPSHLEATFEALVARTTSLSATPQ